MSACTKGLQEPITSQGQEDWKNLLMGNSPCSFLPTINSFFPSMWATRQNNTEIKKQIEALIVFKLQYILGYGICLMMSLVAEVLKKN